MFKPELLVSDERINGKEDGCILGIKEAGGFGEPMLIFEIRTIAAADKISAQLTFEDFQIMNIDFANALEIRNLLDKFLEKNKKTP